MTDTPLIAAAATVAVPGLFAALAAAAPRRWLTPVAVAGGITTSGLSLALAGSALVESAAPHVTNWIVLDAAGGLLLAVIGTVGLVSVLTSPAYLGQHHRSGRRRGPRSYYVALFAFWAALLAVPIAGNLGAAWLLVEATTAASALLVGFSGRPRALEAGWKYLVLTSLGLGVALLGMALVAAGVPGAGLGALSWRALSTYASGSEAGMVAYLLLIAGLAAKIGWAPVHNWLPDAHSEAPAPVSALLSAALLPTVLLVAWRCQQGMAVPVGVGRTRAVFIAFGLLSIAVAVPFLGRALPFKRLLAYSSLEHMGVIALGIGFASPLALAGVVVHIAGHAIAKSVGFTSVTPLLSARPQAATRAVAGVGRSQPMLGATIALSLGALAGLPPSPLFVSELLIVAGGFQTGHPIAAAVAATLIALAFLGLLKATLTTTAAEPEAEGSASTARQDIVPAGMRGVTVLTVAATVGLLALAGTSWTLPTTELVQALVKGIQ